MATIRLRAFPRIHFGLIDLAGATLRRYGGAGISLDGLVTEVHASEAKHGAIHGLELLSTRDATDVTQLLNRLANELGSDWNLQLERITPQHVGLGSKTCLLLAVAKACSFVKGDTLQRGRLQLLSGRGGASGIGINSFFDGGFLVDLGQPATRDTEFRPSGLSTPTFVPLAPLRLPIPTSWRFHLFIPTGLTYSGGLEGDFFRRNTPIPAQEALCTLASIYHGVVAAFAYADFQLFRNAIREIQKTGFKRIEIAGQSECVRELILKLDKEANLAVGMSSMGPLVYAVSESDASAIEDQMRSLHQAGMATYLGSFKGRNSGYEFLNDPSE